MERSRTSQLRASEASVANSTARLLRTGSAPGKPRQTGQTLVLGGDPKRLTQPQKALVSVRSWTWTSRPMTGSYLARISGATVAAVAIFRSSLAISKAGSWELGAGSREQGAGNRNDFRDPSAGKR